MNPNTPLLCAVAAIAIHVLVRSTKSRIPDAFRPWLGVIVGQALAAVDMAARGTPIKEAMAAGAVAACGAISAHELGAKRIKRVPRPPTLPLVCLFLFGCQGITARMAAAGGRFLVQADPILLAYYVKEQETCLTMAPTSRQPCVTAVRAKWAPLRASRDTLRAEWCAVEPQKCEAK